MLGRGGLKLPLLHMIERDEIDVGRDRPCMSGQKPRLLRAVVHAVDHGVLKGDAPTGFLIVGFARPDQLLHAPPVIGGHDAGSCLIVRRVQ